MNSQRSTFLFHFSTLLILSILLSCLVFSGCNMDSQQRIAALQEGLQFYQTESVRLDADLQELKTVIAETLSELDKPDLTSELTVKLQEFLEQSVVAMEAVATQKTDVDAKLTAWQLKIDEITAAGEVNFGTELQVVGAGAKEIAPALPPPFNTIAYLGGTFLLTLGGIWSQRKIGSLIVDSRALGEVITGNERFKDSLSTPGHAATLTAFKSAHITAQSDTTATVIATRRIPLKNKIIILPETKS